MNNFLERFEEFYNQSKTKYVIYKDVLWFEYQKAIIPLGPVKYNYSLKEDEAKNLLTKFPRAFLLRFTDGFNSRNKNPDWYAVINDKPIDINSISSERRSEIKRGLKNCSIERIDINYLSRYGFDIYCSAFTRYQNTKIDPVSENTFKEKMLLKKSYSDIFHHWGVFYDSKLIGYAENLIFNNVECNYSSIKINPNYLTYYPSYALFYTMNSYYISQKKFEYVNDGFRSLYHQTNIQDFLIKKFHFHKEFVNLYVHYKSLLSLTLSTTYNRTFIKKVVSKWLPKAKALYKLEEIRRKNEKFLLK